MLYASDTFCLILYKQDGLEVNNDNEAPPPLKSKKGNFTDAGAANLMDVVSGWRMQS